MNKTKHKRQTRSLSERETRLVQLLSEGKGINGHDFYDVMLKAGYSRSTACSQQGRTRTKLPIQKAIISARITKGLYVTPEERALVGNVENV